MPAIRPASVRGESGGNGGPRLFQRGRRGIDSDDARRRLLAADALEDQLRDGARAAAQIDDHLATRANHPLEDPAVDLREEGMPREGREREALVVRVVVA